MKSLCAIDEHKYYSMKIAKKPHSCKNTTISVNCSYDEKRDASLIYKQVNSSIVYATMKSKYDTRKVG